MREERRAAKLVGGANVSSAVGLSSADIAGLIAVGRKSPSSSTAISPAMSASSSNRAVSRSLRPTSFAAAHLAHPEPAVAQRLRRVLAEVREDHREVADRGERGFRRRLVDARHADRGFPGAGGDRDNPGKTRPWRKLTATSRAITARSQLTATSIECRSSQPTGVRSEWAAA